MSHPARGPVKTGIDGQAIAATSRIDVACIATLVRKARRMSHPARGPVLTGIDGQANAATSRHRADDISHNARGRGA